MIAIRAPVTTNVDCPTKIGQKCFCAVRDKHLFHISFNEALLIGAANSLVSENNPETIDSVRKCITNRPFLREFPKISEKKTQKPTKPKKSKKTKKPKTKKKKQKNQNNQKKQKTKKTKDLATSLPTAIFGQIFVFFGFLFFFVFCFFFWFFCFFGFCIFFDFFVFF